MGETTQRHEIDGDPAIGDGRLGLGGHDRGVQNRLRPATSADLSPQQRQFAQHYAKTGKVGESGRVAGMSESTASRAKRNDNVQAYLDELERYEEEIVKLGAERLKAMAFQLAMNSTNEAVKINAVKLLMQTEGMLVNTIRQEDVSTEELHKILADNLGKDTADAILGLKQPPNSSDSTAQSDQDHAT